MKTILTILLIAFSVSVSAQLRSPFLEYNFENNALDSSGNGYDMKEYGDVTYTSVNRAVGSYSGYMAGTNDYWRIPIVDLGSEFFISFWAYTETVMADARNLITVADASDNFYIRSATTGGPLKAYTVSNSITGIPWTSQQWHHVVFYVKKGVTSYGSMWLDGVRIAQPDSTLNGTFNSNDSIFIGCDYYRSQDFTGYIDEIRAYKLGRPNQAKIDSLLNLDYNDPIGGVPYAPVAGRHVRFYANGVEKKDKTGQTGFKYWKAKVRQTLNYHLSHNQYMVTYDGAENNDIVGTFDPWYVTDYTSSDAYSYALTDSKGGIYAINSSTGVVTVADNASMTSGTDTITVAVTLGSITESYQAYITVRDEANCHFIDNTQHTNGTGSRASPYNTWSGITFQAGHAYFMKRGTTYSANINANVNGSAGNEIIYAAYGTGDKPRITNVVANNGLTIRADYIWVFEFYFGNNLTGIRTPGNVDLYQYCRISDCEFNSNATSGNGQLYFQKYGTSGQYNWYHEVYDCKAYNTGGTGEQYGIKIEGSAVKVRNFSGYNNRSQAISIPMWGYRDTLSGVLAYNNGKHQVELSGRYHELSQSYLSGGIGSVAIMDTGSYFTTIRNNTMIGGTYKGAIAITCNTGGISYGGNFTIQDNIIHDVTVARAGIYVAWNVVDVTIRRNKIYNCTKGVEIGEYETGLSNIKLHYNLLYNNTTDISGLSGSDIYVYNNTCDGAINLTGTTSYVYNTLYRTLTGYTVQSNNLDIDLITVGDYFRDYSVRDYHLKSTASLCINQGYDVGLTIDLDSKAISGLPDIGAYEY